jgi:hypothetical protein
VEKCRGETLYKHPQKKLERYVDHIRLDLIHDGVLQPDTVHNYFVAFDIECCLDNQKQKISDNTTEYGSFKLISIAYTVYNPWEEEFVTTTLTRDPAMDQESLYALCGEFYDALLKIQKNHNSKISEKIIKEKWRLIRLKRSDEFRKFSVEKQAKIFQRSKRVEEFFSLNVYGWNSERFDLSILINPLTKVIQRRHPSLLSRGKSSDSEYCPKMSMIQRGSGIMVAQFGDIIFKDMMNLVSHMALEKFCQSFQVEDWSKLAYPYERFYGISELENYKSFPPYSDFYSRLYIPVKDNVRELNEILDSRSMSEEDLMQALQISAVDYNALKDGNVLMPINTRTKQFFNISIKKYLASREEFVKENCSNMLDWLITYNEIDTNILAEGIVNYAANFLTDYDINIHRYISLAGVAERVAFGMMPFEATPIYSVTDARIREDIRSALNGGMTMVFHRLIQLSVPKGSFPVAARIADNGEVYKKISQYDVNSLYPFVLQVRNQNKISYSILTGRSPFGSWNRHPSGRSWRFRTGEGQRYL